METPSSLRRITRSQVLGSSQKNKQEDSLTKSRTNANPERSALLDITNDSPIVGLANGSFAEKTPASSAVKNRGQVKNTPGSGEALLRGQVKTLLQKVEEEAELVNKIPLGERPPFKVTIGLPVYSPNLLLAPTPANTPQILSLSASKEEDVLMMETLVPSFGEKNEQEISPSQLAETAEQEECLVNRALLFDSPEKSEASDASSALTFQGSEISGCEYKSPEDDSSSAWSMQVNTSIQDGDEEDEGEGYDEAEEKEEDGDYEEEFDEGFDDLCEGLSKMSVKDTVKLPEFAGKHTRFVYNSDDEIEGEEIEDNSNKAVSPSVILLKGLPVPEGKHLRFQDEEEA